MTAKKKRKKLNCSYLGVPRDHGVIPLELSAQCIPPLWAALLSIGFDAGSVQDDGDPGGEVLTISSTVKTATTNYDENEDCGFYVNEEQIGNLDKDFLRFVKKLFGSIENVEKSGENLKFLSFVSRVGSIAQEREIKWNVIRWNEASLYVQINSAAFPEGSRDAFVQLLEYAEEELECENVVVCIPSEQDHRDVIMKTFMFLGFSPMRPGHPLIPSVDKVEGADKYMYMGYIIG